MKVAFQGMLGAYSHQALGIYFKEEVTSIPTVLSDDVFLSVVNEEADFGFVPVENSIVGNVAVNMDLFFKFDVQIVGEFYLPINHCLLAKPGVNIDHVSEVYSHPVALEQCRTFMSDHNLAPRSDYDTAGAAKNIAEQKDDTKAAIASKLCAEYYNLNILAENIQSTSTNITRFFAFCLKNNAPERKKEKMSLYVQTDHTPGSLLKVLSVFSQHQINLTRLESRPIPENPFTYSFYIDLLCEDNLCQVHEAINDLEKLNAVVKELGLYPVG